MASQDEVTILFPPVDIPSILEKIIFAGIVFILALPLLGDYGTWLFPLGRDIIFKLAVEFIFLLFVVKNLISPSLLKSDFNRPSAVTISLFSFWLVMLLASIFSVQQDFSIWGNIYKNQGLMTWTHYVLFFFLLINFFRDKKHWNFLIHTAIFVATLVGLLALWQVFQNGFYSRAASTLNNSNYLAAYLVILLPVAFAFFLKNKTFILGSAMAIQFIALLLTQTRGGYFGIAVAAIVFALLYTRRKKILIPVAVVIASCLFVIVAPLGQSFQQKLPDFTDRFLNRQNIISGSGPRLEAWRAGWQGMLARPILGYGPENFFVAFGEHYSGSQDHSGSLAKEGSLWESWFDKAHNFIFDIGATMGFPGLFAYAAIFISAVWMLIRRLRIRNYESRIMAIGLISSFAGYLAQNLLGFDTIVPGIYLMFLLGYSHFIINSQHKIRSTNLFRISSASWRIGFRILLLCVTLAALSLFIFSFKIHLNILRANHQLNLVERLAQRGQIEQTFMVFEKGLEYNSPPVNPNLRRRYAVIALAYYDAVEKRCGANGLGPTSAKASAGKSDPDRLGCAELFADSKKYLIRALELQKQNAATEWPRFTRNYIYAAQISHILGDYENSDLYFEKALELSPGRTSIDVEWDRLQRLRPSAAPL